MVNVAIIVSNSEYSTAQNLECCKEDLNAIEKLVLAANKYDFVEKIENTNSQDLKNRIREIIEKVESCSELFFYFTGHGYQNDEDFYFCATDFNAKKPNETGLSASELHNFIRTLKPQVFVKIVDACNSGLNLIKNLSEVIPVYKESLQNVIHIASCQGDQTSLTGEHLSEFTNYFINAVLKKTSGPLYYSDIISVLKDEYIDNDNRTPHFVTQSNGLEKFAEDAKLFDELRDIYNTVPADNCLQEIVPVVLSDLDILKTNECKFADSKIANEFIDTLFSSVANEINNIENIDDFFTISIKENNKFDCSHTQSFLINVLSKEKRLDELVTAEISREYKKKNPFGILNMGLFGFNDDRDVVETHTLSLNCNLEKVQIIFEFYPKFRSLPKVILTLTCAPSLETAYIFENVSEQYMTDFNHYGSIGKVKYRNWFKFGWTEGTSLLTGKIKDRIEEYLKKSISNAVEKSR